MLGFNHALESSASSSSSLSSSILSLYDTNSPLEFDAEKLETNHVKEKNDETNVFLKHLRKAFITIDENCYCEHSVLPDLKIFSYKNHKSPKKPSYTNPEKSATLSHTIIPCTDRFYHFRC